MLRPPDPKLWMPHLVWQALHGWPQVTFGQRIATVGNGGSEPRWAFPLIQLGLASPLLVPVWVAGLWALMRDENLRVARALALAYVVLFVLLLVGGGKPYYLFGMYPILIAAGAIPVVRWARRARGRCPSLGVLLVVNAILVGWLFLPLVPERSLPGSVQVAVNPILAETVGWPELVATVTAVERSLPVPERAHAVLLTRNYGEAGALDLAREQTGGLPVYSTHNSYGEWEPPPETATTAVVVGYDAETLRQWFTDVRPAARINNAVGLAHAEQGATVTVVRGPRDTWQRLWPSIRSVPRAGA